MQYKDSIPGNPHYIVVTPMETDREIVTIKCQCGFSATTDSWLARSIIIDHKIDALVKAVGLGFEVKYE